ncbi:MAG: polysaccharide deacetylase family protein [Oscillospiraceae bacterium]
MEKLHSVFVCINKKTFRRAMAICAAIAVIGAVVISMYEPRAAKASAHEWGLSFQKDSEMPVPNLTAEELRPFDAFFCGKREKKLYLTFDAGYENGNTPAILDALAKHGAQGAFFVVVPFIKENPDLIKRMVQEGHIVGNHTHHHPNMAQKNEEEFKREIADVEDAFLQLIGKPMEKYYRPPQGKFSDANLEWAKAMGYKTIFWSLAYVDWKQDAQPTHEEAFAKIMSRTHDGAIVLLHTTSSTNAEILDELLGKWESMGYTFGSLAELGA